MTCVTDFRCYINDDMKQCRSNIEVISYFVLRSLNSEVPTKAKFCFQQSYWEARWTLRGNRHICDNPLGQQFLDLAPAPSRHTGIGFGVLFAMTLAKLPAILPR
jgi:hypothetical protein